MFWLACSALTVTWHGLCDEGCCCCSTCWLSCCCPPDDDNDAVLFEKIKSGNYDADDPIWENISAQAKDIVAKLLTVCCLELAVLWWSLCACACVAAYQWSDWGDADEGGAHILFEMSRQLLCRLVDCSHRGAIRY
jgi:hypothetical protein